MKAKQNFACKSQSGMTLTESLLVLSVGALVAVLAYGGYRMATSDVKTQSQTKGIVQMVGKIKQTFGTAANYAGVTVANIINAKIVPADFKTTGTTSIDNAWGGTVTPAAGNETATATNASFRIVITNIPAEGCVDFLSGLSSSANSLWMGAVVGSVTAGTHDVKPLGGAFDAARAATQCAASTGTGATSTAILVTQ